MQRAWYALCIAIKEGAAFKPFQIAMKNFYRLAIVMPLISGSRCAAAETPAGRWEGSIKIPGREIPAIVDLAQSGNKWTGSIILRGLDVKGAPLTDISIADATISFMIKGALSSERVGSAKIQGALSNAGEWSGEFLQGGNSAPFVLHKTGPPQVELPRQSTAVAREFEGEWKGDYEMDGYPRHVTLKLANHGTGPATAELVVVGKRVNNAPVELVVDENGLLTLESSTFGITYEGRLQKEAGAIKGTFTIGPFERPLVLQHTR
jgi:hypothetical protein